jgi:allantoate deiminase
MKLRKDALAGAAAWITEVEREAMSTPGLVATVGNIEVEPGAGNVIAGRAILSVDVRHPADQMRKAAFERLRQAAEDIAGRRGLQIGWESRLDQGSVPMDQTLASMLDRAIEQAGFPAHRVTSGAGHDAMVVASRMPAAMMFLRCQNGVSHHPTENVREDDVAAALDAGLKFLDEIARVPRE